MASVKSALYKRKMITTYLVTNLQTCYVQV